MKYLTLFLISLIALKVGAQDIFQVNKDLGRGVNMGNMFEAPSEDAWGNPFRDDYFEKIAGLGFNHVRIPITWDVSARTLQTAPFTIHADFMARIKYVVDKAQEAGLMVIINMHHHEDIFADPDAAKEEFLSQWQQIAEVFKDYDNNLLFEPLNEPHGNLSPEQWNTYFADALAVIREDNPSRAVIMGIANYGGLSAVPQIIFPEGDSQIILSIHYYEPFQFTHQGAGWVNNSTPWLGTKWDNTDLEQKTIKSQFRFATNFAEENNVPINIGEFGAYSTADMDSRVLWTTFLARWFEEQGYSWAYWEFSSGFGFFNPNTNQYNQRLIDALLKDALPEAVVTETNTVYESDFTSGNSGWNLSAQGGAMATFEREGNKAKIDVTAIGSDAWQVQFVLNNIALKEGKQYLVSFKAVSGNEVSSTSYVGQSEAPWGAYSGYTGVSIGTTEEEYQYGFEMKSENDDKARFVFDFGNAVGTTFLSDLKVEEVVGEEEIVLARELGDASIRVYPNPTSSYIVVEMTKKIDSYKLYTLKGALVQSENKLESNIITLRNGLASGAYFLRLKAEDNVWIRRVMVF
ncbi:MAG: endoglucanase [Algoriphagus sp.]|jgi:endoglucanase